jgi:hypothetical protein
LLKETVAAEPTSLTADLSLSSSSHLTEQVKRAISVKSDAWFWRKAEQILDYDSLLFPGSQ